MESVSSSTTEVSSRLGTSIAEDVDEYVPEEATAAITDIARETPSILTTDDKMYVTDVHCSRCFCDVAEWDHGVVTCPACGWTSEGGEGGASQ